MLRYLQFAKDDNRKQVGDTLLAGGKFLIFETLFCDVKVKSRHSITLYFLVNKITKIEDLEVKYVVY